MLEAGRVLAFAVTAFALIVVPGPSVLFVISRGVALGRRVALATVVGNAVGVYLQVVAVAVGLGALIAQSIAAYTVVKLLGAAYLVWLGVQALRTRNAVSVADAAGGAEEPVSLRVAARQGFLVGVGNPKAIVFFTAVLPQFVDPVAGSPSLQLLLLGLVFIAVALLSDGAWAVLAGSARRWFADSPSRLRRLTGGGGVVMIGLGVRLALTGRND